MKFSKTQFLEAERNIRFQLSSFVSIVVIALLAVTVYLGISYSSRAMDLNISKYYGERNMQDIQVFSPFLLTKEDVEEIKNLNTVNDAEGMFETVAWMPTDLGSFNVSVISMPERISLPEITEGRAPQADGECMVEELLLRQTDLKIGDHIRLQNKSGDTAALLTETDFTVTGFFQHPDHITDKVDVTEYIIVTEGVFDQSLLEGCWPRVRITLSDMPANRFSKEYWNCIAPTEDALQQLSAERSPKRANDVRDSYKKRIDDGEAQLSDALAKLNDAESQISDGESRLNDGAQSVAEGETKIAEAQKKIEDGEKKLTEGEKDLAKAEAENADAIEQYNQGMLDLSEAERKLGLAPGQLTGAEILLTDGQGKLTAAKELIETQKERLDNADIIVEDIYIIWKEAGYVPTPEQVRKAKKNIYDLTGFDVSDFPDEVPPEILEWSSDKALNWLYEAIGLDKAWAEFDKIIAEYEAKKDEYEQGRINYYYEGEEYLDGMLRYEQGKKKLDAASVQIQQLEDAKKEIEEKREELEFAKQELADSRKQLEDGKQQLEDGEREIAEKKKEYQEGLEKYRNARANLDALEKQFDELDDSSWMIMNNKSNTGYLFSSENSNNLSSLSSTFSLLFIAIAALVIYASVARMVDEQSVLVGTTKAMGFYKREVMLKYLMFGMRSTLLGVIGGILIAYFVLQALVLTMYAPYYIVPKASKCFLIVPTVIIFIGGIVLSLAAVLTASSSLLKTSAVKLMKGKQPQIKRKGRKKASGSLYTRLILLNMSSDLTRVIVTIVSITGCCILLMIGFTLKYGQDRIVGRQYGQVMTFDAELMFDPDNPETEGNLMHLFVDKGIAFHRVYQESRVFSAGKSLSACTMICADPVSLPGWYNLYDIKTGDLLPAPNHDVLITKRMHETCSIGHGDPITFYDSSMNASESKVAGIFNNYFGQMVFISPEAYKEVFGSEAVPNCFYLKLNGDDIESLRAEAAKIDGFLSLSDAASRRTQIENTAKAMNVLIIVMIVMAGLMAWFILDNLSGIYMLHKKKELTVMRVNGFSTEECVRYAAIELIITTVLGILIGVPSGAWLGYRVIRLTEQSFVQMDRTLDIRSVIFSVLITAAFALIINGMALSKVKDLKLSDAAN